MKISHFPTPQSIPERIIEHFFTPRSSRSTRFSIHYVSCRVEVMREKGIGAFIVAQFLWSLLPISFSQSRTRAGMSMSLSQNTYSLRGLLTS